MRCATYCCTFYCDTYLYLLIFLTCTELVLSIPTWIQYLEMNDEMKICSRVLLSTYLNSSTLLRRIHLRKSEYGDNGEEYRALLT